MSGILVLVPTVKEWKAFEQVFDLGHPFEKEIYSIPSEWTNYAQRAFAACLNGQGRAVGERARDLIEKLSPSLVIISGIAGAAKGKGLRIGDIAISTSFVSPQRIRETHNSPASATLEVQAISIAKELWCPSRFASISRMVSSQVNEFLSNKSAFDNFQLDEISELREELVNFHPTIHFSEFFSSIENDQTGRSFKLVKSAHRDVRCVEMELFQVSEEMKRLGRKDHPVLVKAISDISPAPKKGVSEPLKKIARFVSAHVMKILLKEPTISLAISELRYRDIAILQRRSDDRLEEKLFSAFEVGSSSAIIDCLDKGLNPEIVSHHLAEQFNVMCARCTGGAHTSKNFINVVRDIYPILEKKLSSNVVGCSRLVQVAHLARSFGLVVSDAHSDVQKWVRVFENPRLRVEASDSGIALLYGLRGDEIKRFHNQIRCYLEDLGVLYGDYILAADFSASIRAVNLKSSDGIKKIVDSMEAALRRADLALPDTQYRRQEFYLLRDILDFVSGAKSGAEVVRRRDRIRDTLDHIISYERKFDNKRLFPAALTYAAALAGGITFEDGDLWARRELDRNQFEKSGIIDHPVMPRKIFDEIARFNAKRS